MSIAWLADMASLALGVLEDVREDLGNLGVRTFFVISGFLITTLLLDERAATGSISLKKFYLRRVFRIFPASYVYIAIIALLSALGVITLKHNDLLCAVTYTVNNHYERSWWVGHLWSLSVEEQFYLLWPAVMVWLGTKKAFWVAVVTVILAPLFRTAGAPPRNWECLSDGRRCHRNRLHSSLHAGKIRRSVAIFAVLAIPVVHSRADCRFCVQLSHLGEAFSSAWRNTSKHRPGVMH
jgi:hypothetical protein